MRRKALCTAAPACLLLGLSPLAAYADTTPSTPATPAPAATATATAARVSEVIHISDTSARADATKGSAQATVISVAGQPLLGAGGSQNHEGESHGAVLDTGAALPAHLQVAPWRTAVTGSSATTHRHSHGDAAVARLEIPSLIKASVLGSQADADHTSEKSTATSTSDAADVSITDAIRVVLLHSEVNSVGKGHSYLIGLNGNEIGTDSQLGKSPLCALDASVASLSCLTAAGGVGSNGMTSGNAEVAAVQSAALGVINPVDAFATAASSGTGTTPPSIVPSVGSVLPAETARAAAVTPAATPPAALPRTGAAIASTLASGFAALVSGLGLSLFGRRRRRRAA